MGRRFTPPFHLIAGLLVFIFWFSHIGLGQQLVALDCSDASDTFDCAPVSGGIYTYTLLSAPATLNPVTATDTASLYMLDHLFGTYTTSYALLGGGYVGTAPQLASIIEINPEGTAILYTLRIGLKFSDGTPVTTDDILYWYHDVVQNPHLPNSLQETMICPSSDQPFTLEAISERQLRISCPAPFRTFSMDAARLPILSKQMALDLISAQNIPTESGVIGSRATKEFLGLTVAADSKLREKIRAIGPFMLSQFDSQAAVRFVRNPNFYESDSNGKRLPYLDGLDMIVNTAGGLDQALTNFLNGETDAMETRPSDISAIISHAFTSGFSINNDIDNGTAASGTTFVTLNFDDMHPGLADAARRVNVRRALSLAIDRVAAVNNVYFGIGTPLYGSVSLGGSSGSLFFIGRDNTCENFRKYAAPCARNAGKKEAVETRNGLRVQVQNLPPPGLTPESDEHLSCLFNYATCLAKANALLDAEGLIDTDGNGIRNLSDGKDWQIQIVTNSGGVVRPESAIVVCDGWKQLGIECSSVEIAFAALVNQLLGLQSWSGAILLGLSGGDPAGGVNVYKCGAELYFWHSSCDPEAASGLTAQDSASAEVEAAFDEGFSAATLSAAQSGFDKFQIAWFENEPFIHILTTNQLFAVRTDRLCNDGRTVNARDDIKFRVDIPGNDRACTSNAGR